MKKINIILITLIIALCIIPNINYNNEKPLRIRNNIKVKYLDSSVLTKVVEQVNLEEEEEQEESIEEIEKAEVIEEEKAQPKSTESPVKEKTVVESSPKQEVKNNEILTGKMSAYGPDCAGCSGYLGSGRYVGDGNIYYEDSTYGKVRIVAGDSKFSYGTIVKITDKTGEFLAIVLDRGGVGLNKRYMFDLLFPSENDASDYGISTATFEILRYGY